MTDPERPRPLTRAVLARPALEVAPDLLGHHLVHDGPTGVTRVRITETEAYEGAEDPASHAFRGRTERTSAMFGAAGTAYVYRSYGIHLALNVVCGQEGIASAVLLRAGEVLEGLELALARRGPMPARLLARGPGNLARAVGIEVDHYGLDLLDPASQLRLEPGPAPGKVACGPRVGVSRAADQPWRFWLLADPTVSAYRRSPRALDDA